MKNLSMKQQIELEMQRAQAIRNVRETFQRAMAKLAKQEVQTKASGQ